MVFPVAQLVVLLMGSHFSPSRQLLDQVGTEIEVETEMKKKRKKQGEKE